MTAMPDVPVHLQDRPRSGGLVVPWITPATHNGLYLFGKITDLAQYRCLTGRLCQVCSRHLDARAVLFARESDLAYACASEPAVCPPCAAYSARACPMLAGRRVRYRGSEHPTLAGIPLAADQLLRQSAPAEPWYAVWVDAYDVISHPAQPGTLAASWRRFPPLRIRPVPITA